MAHHIIDVSFIGAKVHADPNPLPKPGGDPPEVRPGDTVTWNIPVGRTLQIAFLGIRNLDAAGNPTGNLLPTGPQGPFKSLAIGALTIVGTVDSNVSQSITRASRHLYKFVENNVNLEWDNGVPGEPATNGGGIDIPRTPP
jgi:hypothetical protein